MLAEQSTVDPIRFELSPKQMTAYDYLDHPNYSDISEVVFGGGARGGKSYLGSFWIASSCLKYPGSAWLIAREELKTLKRTTLRTFFKVIHSMGWVPGVHYKFNAQEMVLSCVNGSTVFFGELKKIPSDPEFDRIGSYDLTGAWVDEAQEICKDAKDALQFRFTVLSGEGWSTYPKTLYTCNPGKNWIYSDFWKPIIKEGVEVDGKMFITSLYSDNPYIDHEKYRKNVLRTKNKVKIARLLEGNFEYDDDPARIFVYDKILDLFTNRVEKVDDQWFISHDVARTIDRIVIGLWHGMQLKKIYSLRNKKINEQSDFVIDLAVKFGVPRSNIIIDADGLGVGVCDLIEGSKRFHNGGSAIHPYEAKYDETHKLNFANLKTQCYMQLAEMVNAAKIGIDEIDDEEIKEHLIEELEIQKQINIDKDHKKTQIQSKDVIKELLGRSPDISDMMMMRMFFELHEEPELAFHAI